MFRPKLPSGAPSAIFQGLLLLGIVFSTHQAAANTASRDVLAGSVWENCSFIYAERDSQTDKETNIYIKSRDTFFADGAYSHWIEGYASDSRCQTFLQFSDVIKFLESATPPGEAMTGYYVIPNEAISSQGVYPYDLHVRSPMQVDFYTSIKLDGDTLLISDRCQNEDYIREGLCQKIDGFRPEERANYLHRSDMIMETLTRVR
jgi:hypothetical protein